MSATACRRHTAQTPNPTLTPTLTLTLTLTLTVGYCVQANGISWPWAISGGPLTDGRFGDFLGSSNP